MQTATNMTFLAVCQRFSPSRPATAAMDEKIGTSVGAKAQLTLQTAAKIRSNMLVASPCDNDADCNFPRGRCEPSAKADVDGKML